MKTMRFNYYHSLGRFSRRQILFFFFFSEIDFDILQIVLLEDSLHEMSNSVF